MRTIHFVTGGFSGATQVAVDLVRATNAGRGEGHREVLLALRVKRHTDMTRVDALRAEGLDVALIAGWSHLATIWALSRLCLRWRPDVLVSHGFSDHIWGRCAGLLARVRHLVHVEHNTRERYTAWRRLQTRWLARHTGLFVGVSEGVRESLLRLGMPADRTIAIPNGTRLEPFAAAADHPFEQRERAILMPARFASQKDHATLLRAVALLRAEGLRPRVALAGGGSRRHERRARRLCTRLGLDDQVEFLGRRTDVPALLMSRQICVLSSHYEGMPLTLVEAMAAGCVAVGSAVPGIREMLSDGVDGRVFEHASAPALAAVLRDLLDRPQEAAAIAQRGRDAAASRYTLQGMLARYEFAFAEMVRRDAVPGLHHPMVA
jgi:glycosyltransferase involved in cell wall biosynthesis